MSGKITATVQENVIAARVADDGTIVATVSGVGGISATAAGGFGPQGPPGPPGTTLWSGLVGVPSTFPATPHAASHGLGGSDQITVAFGQITGLQAALDAKAAISHVHTASQITDFNSAVAAAAPPTTDASLLTSGTLADARLSANVVFTTDARLSDARTPVAHTHTASQITDFNSAVAAAAPPTTDASLLTSGTLADARLSANVVFTTDARLSDARTPVAHTHTASEIIDFNTAVAAAAPLPALTITGGVTSPLVLELTQQVTA